MTITITISTGVSLLCLVLTVLCCHAILCFAFGEISPIQSNPRIYSIYLPNPFAFGEISPIQSNSIQPNHPNHSIYSPNPFAFGEISPIQSNNPIIYPPIHRIFPFNPFNLSTQSIQSINPIQ